MRTNQASRTPDDSPSLDAYRAKARDWLARTAIPDLPLEHAERFRTARLWQRMLFEAAWMGIDWPRKYGGQGLSVRHRIVFWEELVRARAPYPIGLIGLDVVGPTIIKYGTDEQRKRFIAPLLAGDEIWCQGFSEPGAGSDLASLRTRGRQRNGALIVSGQKVWTSWAAEADWCAALVRTDPATPRHDGITYVLIDMHSRGITVRPILQMTGDAEFNEVFFDDVQVSLENVLGGLGGGWQLAMDTLGHERGGYALRRRMENQIAFNDMVTSIRDDLARAGESPDERTAWAIGRLAVELRAFEAQSRATVNRLDMGEVPSPMDSVDKLTLTETEQHVYETGVELLGAERMNAAAWPRGLHAERWVKGLMYARSASVYGGTSEIQRTIIAERLLGLPRGR